VPIRNGGIDGLLRIARIAVAGVVPVLAVAVIATRSEAAKAPPAAEVLLTRPLDKPNGLAFNPVDGSLWIVNNSRRALDRTVVVRDLGTANQTVRAFEDPTYHYLAEPTAIAFSPTRLEFATAGTIGGGPTLWTSEEHLFRGGQESHYDMVHHTESVTGIAVGADNVRREYWVVNGTRGTIDRYFFNEPHELGGMDHSDGLVYRYGESALKDVVGVPTHVAFDHATGTVYVADTGHNRIAWLRTGAPPADAKEIIRPRWLPEKLFRVEGPRIRTLARGLKRPSGLLLKDRRLLVGEYATGRIVVLTLSGRRMRTIDTGLGKNALTGLAAGPDGRIYFLDAKRNRLLRLRATLP
jgi:hypothetical protein